MRAECVFVPFRAQPTSVPADVGRIYLDGVWNRDFRWGLWPGQRDTVFVCGRPEQHLAMRFARDGIETADATMIDAAGESVPPPYPLSMFDTPTERALKFIAEKCRGGCAYDVNTDGVLNETDQIVIERVVQGKLR